MPQVMPDSHIPVNPKYSQPAVETACFPVQNIPMRNLREIREARGLSQVELSEMVGCSQGMIAKVENGKANPTLRLIEKIAKALKVSPVALFGLCDVQARMISALDAIPEDQRPAALVVLEAMANQPR